METLSLIRMRPFILTVYEYTCQYCCNRHEENELELEHIFPRSKGGDDSLGNITLACCKCNSRKSNLILPLAGRYLLQARAEIKAKKIIELFEKTLRLATAKVQSNTAEPIDGKSQPDASKRFYRLLLTWSEPPYSQYTEFTFGDWFVKVPLEIEPQVMNMWKECGSWKLVTDDLFGEGCYLQLRRSDYESIMNRSVGNRLDLARARKGTPSEMVYNYSEILSRCIDTPTEIFFHFTIPPPVVDLLFTTLSRK